MIDPSDVVCPREVGGYALGKDVAFGSFAVVKLAKKRGTDESYAVKIVPRSKLSNADLEERFEQEIRVLQQMKHKNVTKLYDLVKDENNFYIFMEYCPNGELFQVIVDKRYLSEDESKKYLAQIADALRYVHRMGACHRDLKPENLLLGEKGELKITDFGFSRYVGESGLCDTACGSPCYVSPECLSGNPYVGSKSDIWSAGVIFFVMCTGKLPWTKRNQAKLFEQIQKGEYTVPKNLSSECKEIIERMMCVDPEKRITADEILQHHWMKDSIKPEKKDPVQLGVTLKLVDKFFDRDHSSGLFENLYLDKQSGRPQDFTTMRRMIRQATPPLEMSSKLPPLAKTRKNQTNQFAKKSGLCLNRMSRSVAMKNLSKN